MSSTTFTDEELHPAAKFQGAIPPPYNAVEKLPTYQEMQDWKKYEAQQEILNIYFPPDVSYIIISYYKPLCDLTSLRLDLFATCPLTLTKTCL